MEKWAWKSEGENKDCDYIYRQIEKISEGFVDTYNSYKAELLLKPFIKEKKTYQVFFFLNFQL